MQIRFLIIMQTKTSEQLKISIKNDFRFYEKKLLTIAEFSYIIV